MYTDYEEDKESFYSDDDNNSQNSERIKKIAIFILIFVIIIVLILILAKSCAKNNNNNNNTSSNVVTNQKPTVMISRETLSLYVGEEFDLQADVLNTKNTNPAIMWRSNDTSIVSVNDDGQIKAEAEGTTAIIASYNENNRTYSNVCIVTVTSKVVKLESIKLSQKEIKMRKGATFLIEVTITPSDAKVDKFIYESSDSNVATVDSKGYIKSIAAGTTTITVKTEDGSVSDTMSVVVTESQQTVTTIDPTGIELIGFTNGLTIGKTTQAVHNITPNSATNKNVTWKSSDPSIATVDSNGIVTGVGVGICTITVSTSNNITSSKNIIVSSNTVAVDKVTIVGATSFNMKVGGTRYLYYTISPSDATNKKVSYKSSNPSVVFVDSNGILAGVGVGTAIITITTQDGGKTAVANVTVTAATASGTSSAGSTSSSSGTTSSTTRDTSTYDYSTDSSTYYPSNYYDTYNDDTPTSTCNAYDMLSIKHNESKDIYPENYAVVSTISFDNTKPFTRKAVTPTLELTQFNSCYKSLSYKIYYGKDVNNVNTVVKNGTLSKVGDTIKLEKGDGYYRIEVTGKTISDGTSLTKTYYAYVKNGQSTEYITISSKQANSKTTFTITKNDSLVTRVYYCVSSAKNCTPSIQVDQFRLNSDKTLFYGYITMNKDTFYKTMTYGGYNKQPSFDSGYKVCFQGYNGNVLMGEPICKYI